MRFLCSFILINFLLIGTGESQPHSWQNYGALGFNNLVNDKADPGNIVWMYHGGVIRYDVATDSAVIFDPTNSKMPLYSIRAMAPAEGGGVWVAYYTQRPYSGMGAGNNRNTPGGISKITTDTIINFSLEDLSLPNYYILSMFEDSQNRLWINAENGVAGYFDGVVWNPLPPGIGWPNAKHFQYPAAEDDSGNIWIMKPDKGFIVLKNYTTWDTVSPHNSSLTDTRFSHVFNQSGHGLWAKSDSSLWLYKDSTWFKYPMPSDVVRPFRGLDSLIYLSRQYSGLYRFDGDTFVTIPPVPREYWFTMNAVETNYGIISARDTVFIWNGQDKWTNLGLRGRFGNRYPFYNGVKMKDSSGIIHYYSGFMWTRYDPQADSFWSMEISAPTPVINYYFPPGIASYNGYMYFGMGRRTKNKTALLRYDGNQLEQLDLPRQINSHSIVSHLHSSGKALWIAGEDATYHMIGESIAFAYPEMTRLAKLRSVGYNTGFALKETKRLFLLSYGNATKLRPDLGNILDMELGGDDWLYFITGGQLYGYKDGIYIEFPRPDVGPPLKQFYRLFIDPQNRPWIFARTDEAMGFFVKNPDRWIFLSMDEYPFPYPELDAVIFDDEECQWFFNERGTAARRCCHIDFQPSYAPPLCRGDSIQISAMKPLTITNDDTIILSMIQPKDEGIMLFGAFDTSGCYGERHLDITFEPEPYINLGQDLVLECWDRVNVYANHNGTHLQWSTGETGDQVTVMHSQTLTATTDAVCGSASDTVQVVLADGTPIQTYFSPNGDGRNDTYELPMILRNVFVRARFYNTMGQLLYESTDPDFQFNNAFNPFGNASQIIVMELTTRCANQNVAKGYKILMER